MFRRIPAIAVVLSTSFGAYLLMAPTVGVAVSATEGAWLMGSACAKDGTTSKLYCAIENEACFGCGCTSVQARVDGDNKLKEDATACSTSTNCTDVWDYASSGTCG